jgi:hypothetical protein
MRYNKAELERIVVAQLDNLDAMNDLVAIMRTQNELLRKANERLESVVEEFGKKRYKFVRNGTAR